MLKINISSLSEALQATIKKELATHKAETSVPDAYWNEEGDFEEEYNKIWNDFVPAQGKAEKLPAELVRSFARLYKDCKRNGWGNNFKNEIATLKANRRLYEPYYKGEFKLPELLNEISKIQTLSANKPSSWYKKAEYISKSFVEPDLDNLGDAIIQYAYKELYPKKIESTSSMTLRELHYALGRALNNNNASNLDRYRNSINDLLMDSEDKKASIYLIDAIENAIAEIESLQEAE